MKTKICSKCKIRKPINKFSKKGKRQLHSQCKSCCNLYQKSYQKTKKNIISKKKREYYEKNEKIILKHCSEYRKHNPSKIKLWRKKHHPLLNFLQSKRRAAKLKRTPSYANLKDIKQFYLNCPKGMVVDHIIPLQGETISGFHIIQNLQYLTPKENNRKKNKFPYYSKQFYQDHGLFI